jgi:tetratricopeptide (TPR) repeat protein
MMRLLNKLKLGILVAVLSMAMLPLQYVMAGEEQRAPPTARQSGTLGPAVMRAISSIQEMMQPEDEEEEPDYASAKVALDELYERRFERMNDFEKSTTLNFYTNYYLNMEDYPGAIGIFQQMLLIETLRADIRLRTHRSLGQLFASEEDWQGSIDNYEMWREQSESEDEIVFRGLSYAHYQLENFEQAQPFWISRMELVLSEGETLERDDYSYLNGLYFTLEDFESALELTKTMIVLFDDKTDWQNLSAIYAGLEEDDRGVQALNLYYLKGMLDDNSRYINLSQSLAGIDIPHSGAKILAEGMEKEVVETDEENLTRLTQMHLMASEYENALEPAIAAAEADETGNAYDTLGYIQYVLHDYEEAAQAFEEALVKGELSDRSDTLMFLSRARLELREFDAAQEAATEAADQGDERASKSARDFLRAIDGRRTYINTIAGRKEDAIDFYQPYPPLQ